LVPYALVIFGILDSSLEQYAISFAFIVSLAWWYWYSRPMLKEVDQVYSIEQATDSLAQSFKRLGKTFKEIRKYKYIFIFLISYLLYIDVVNSVIRLATNIGGDLGVGATTMLGVIVLVQLIAFPSAIIYGRMTYRFGSKNMLFYGIFVYALGVLIVSQIYADTTWLMWIVGALIGTAQGGIQSISRSYFAKIVPRDKANDFFGFFSVFGRFGGIVSPFIIASFMATSLGTNGSVMLLLIPLAIATVLLAFVKPTVFEDSISE
jgi:UMF1 family MFS transporter